jgi:hypothetical protein
MAGIPVVVPQPPRPDLSALREDLGIITCDACLGDETAVLFLAVEGARQLCAGVPREFSSAHMSVAEQALGMAGYHVSDPLDGELRHELVEAVRIHLLHGPVDPLQRAEEALILTTDAVEGARELLGDRHDDPELAAGLAELHRAVAALVRDLGPGRAEELMLAAAAEPA